MQIPKEVEEFFFKTRAHSKLNLQHFSDSLMAHTLINPKTDFEFANSLNSIHAIFSSIGMTMLWYFSHGIPFRGGIDIEGGIYINSNNELYGPALNRAYQLECEEAKYPRVVVGKGIFEFFDYISQVQFSDQRVRDYCMKAESRCREWLTIDHDGQYIIHYLGSAAKETARSLPVKDSVKQDYIDPIASFIYDSEKRFKDSEKLKIYYGHFKNYFKKHADNWQDF